MTVEEAQKKLDAAYAQLAETILELSGTIKLSASLGESTAVLLAHYRELSEDLKEMDELDDHLTEEFEELIASTIDMAERIQDRITPVYKDF